jgi:hypothetical protein
MGQRLIITEEEKNRIQSLYENMGVAFGNEMNGLKVKKEEATEEVEETMDDVSEEVETDEEEGEEEDEE